MRAHGRAFREIPDPVDTRTGRVTVNLGAVEDIPLGQGRAYSAAGRTIAVFRQRDGRLYATDNHCPHRGGSLADGVLGGGTVICPLHAWKLDLETGLCIGESLRVQVYDVRVVDGRIQVFFESAATSE